jgi:crotonobetainyl-CoA:carnitine CoA-transferase CaiB-like acyl-CoA transferase
VLGAEVIKVESRHRPELLRAMAPDLEKSPTFSALNYGKRSVTLNLTQPQGVALAKRLIKVSDIVTENYATGTMERFGLGYQTLCQLKPDLIMLSISGMGRTGPDSGYVAYAPTIHALGGMCSMTGYVGGPSHLMGAMWGDALAAQTGAFAALAALEHRARTGKGQHIDLAMVQVMLALLPEGVMDYTMNGKVRRPMGNRDEVYAPHGVYRCRGLDKWVAIAVTTDDEWRAFCHALGKPQWAEDERFADTYSRWHHQDILDPLIEEWTQERTACQVMETLQGVGVAAGPSANVAELLNDPHLNQRGFFLDSDHPALGRGRLARLPFRRNSEFVGNYTESPLMGQDNGYVLGELLGLAPGEVSRLIAHKVVY